MNKKKQELNQLNEMVADLRETVERESAKQKLQLEQIEQRKLVVNNAQPPVKKNDGIESVEKNSQVCKPQKVTLGENAKECIKLQPIIVPLAVVPYMTQDQNMVGGVQSAPYHEFGTYCEAETLSGNKSKKKSKIASRFLALFMALISALLVASFILAKFFDFIGPLSLDKINIIDSMNQWAHGYPPQNMIIDLLLTISAGISAFALIGGAVAFLFGDYPKYTSVLGSLLMASPLLAVLIYEIIKNQFVLQKEIVFVILVGVTLLKLLISLIAFVTLSVREKI